MFTTTTIVIVAIAIVITAIATWNHATKKTKREEQALREEEAAYENYRKANLDYNGIVKEYFGPFINSLKKNAEKNTRNIKALEIKKRDIEDAIAHNEEETRLSLSFVENLEVMGSGKKIATEDDIDTDTDK